MADDSVEGERVLLLMVSLVLVNEDTSGGGKQVLEMKL